MFPMRSKSFKENLNYSYVLIILIMIVLTLLISVCFFWYLYYSSTMDSISQITGLAMQNIKYEYNNIEQYAMALSRNEVLQQVMTDTDFSDNQNVTENLIRLRKELDNADYIGSGNNVRIIFASENNKYSYSYFQSESYFCEVNNIDRLKLDDIYIGYVTENSEKYLVYVRPLFADFGSERIGNIAVFYNLEKNFIKFSDINVTNNGVFFVTNENGEILCHHNKDYILKNLKDESYGDKLLNGTKAFRFRDGSKSYFCSVEIMPTTNWRAISVVPTDKFYRDIFLYVAGILAACIIVLLVALNISKKYVRKITYPVNTLCDAMKKTEKVDIEDNNLFVEFEFMANRYNHMICRIRRQMNEIAEKEEEKRKADMRILYEQINPHFLYNTLDSINWLAACSTDEYSEKVTEMVSMLARMFRIGLSRGKEIISVADEIEHVKSYISIQQYRYSGSFDTKYEISDDVLYCRIIKILLQPLVENAIVHGFENYESGGLIIIKACIENNNIVFTVEDNGCGGDVEYVRSLLNKTPENEDSGYGLYNVQKRIRLYYGNDYGIEVYRSDSGGMKFKIIIPHTEDESI